MLHKVQDHFGYLGLEQMDAVSTLMQIPAAKVTGVASFYHFFTFTPRGEHQISLCLGTACFVKGADRVLDKLKELLGIDVGETTKDGLFSLDVARCVGACALAPVMMVDETVYAGVKPGQVAKILSGYGYVGQEGRRSRVTLGRLLEHGAPASRARPAAMRPGRAASSKNLFIALLRSFIRPS